MPDQRGIGVPRNRAQNRKRLVILPLEIQRLPDSELGEAIISDSSPARVAILEAPRQTRRCDFSLSACPLLPTITGRSVGDIAACANVSSLSGCFRCRKSSERGDIPELDQSLSIGRGQESTIGAEGYGRIINVVKTRVLKLKKFFAGVNFAHLNGTKDLPS